MAHQGEYLVVLHQLLGVGHAVGGVKVIVVVDEAHRPAMEAARVVIGFERSVQPRVKGNAHGGKRTGGGGGVSDDNLGLGHALDIGIALIGLLVGRITILLHGSAVVNRGAVIRGLVGRAAGAQGKQQGGAGQQGDESFFIFILLFDWLMVVANI